MERHRHHTVGAPQDITAPLTHQEGEPRRERSTPVVLESVNDVAKAIMQSGLLPRRATRDAIHIGVSSVHGIDILLTWNCRHIANAAIMKELGAIVAACGYELPIRCTPEELLGE